MNTQEKFEDKEIIIRERDAVFLSQLTAEERDLYFAGYRDGVDGCNQEESIWDILMPMLCIAAGIILGGILSR